jgi:hypothetical protein
MRHMQIMFISSNNDTLFLLLIKKNRFLFDTFKIILVLLIITQQIRQKRPIPKTMSRAPVDSIGYKRRMMTYDVFI